VDGVDNASRPARLIRHSMARVPTVGSSRLPAGMAHGGVVSCPRRTYKITVFSRPAPVRRMMRAAALAVLCVAAWPAGAADLVIHVTGLRSGTGDVHYGVYARPETFPKAEGRIAKGFVKARPSGVTIVVRGLAPASYAVAVYHDENGNGEFDQGFFGIPLEGYAFSHGATAFFSAPGFDEAAVTVGKGITEITIEMAY
ncbi:MAG: DUF2141 domain-containing protein, partial [Alphaproteobacteria bacterium]